uniref:cilia- and flagella-associated protein 157 n=1 Tax=Doryrhamphus excisus TaxID=161450 RepID=UPI0025AE25BB|nr:cilia- and flagella-associated protein 157 [Doryrhamphus excisus]
MPKKENKYGHKQDEDKSKTKNKQSEAGQAEENGKEKDLYLIQIRFLNEQLERYKRKCEDVANEKKALSSQCSAMEKEKKDIVDYLKRSLLEKEDELDEISQRLQALRREADEDKDALRQQLDLERRQLGARIDELEEDNERLVARLAAVEEFKKQKEKMSSDVELLEKQLASREAEHAAAMHAMEMKALLDKSRLIDRMDARAAAVAADTERLMERKLPETTRRTAQENQEVKARYAVLSEKAHDLARENATLREQKGLLAADVDVLERTLSEMSRQSCVRKKVVQQLSAKCQQLQMKEMKESDRDLGAKEEDVGAEPEVLRKCQASATTATARLEAELQQERKRRTGTRRVAVMKARAGIQ